MFVETCGQKCSNCIRPFNLRLDCGHTKRIHCHQRYSGEGLECVESCTKTLKCGHQCVERYFLNSKFSPTLSGLSRPTSWHWDIDDTGATSFCYVFQRDLRQFWGQFWALARSYPLSIRVLFSSCSIGKWNSDGLILETADYGINLHFDSESAPSKTHKDVVQEIILVFV